MNAPQKVATVVRRPPLQSGLVALALLMIGVVAAGLLANASHRQAPAVVARLPVAQSPTPADALAVPNVLKPLSPEEAIKENQDRPFDALPDTPAAKFHIKTDQESRSRAIECLSQAVYYEAATEGIDGQRAVAQVVLNRMRHPGFPSSVCGVVYQGSGLPTGCQFTFTCNGSLARTPIPSLWKEAEKIATQALDGHVFAAVGHATHYHADYVLPYWADSLAKQVQIGHHIFYRLKGVLGTSAAFSQHYAGAEPALPSPPSTSAAVTQAADQALLNSALAGPPPVAADSAGVAAQPELKDALVADKNRGHLLIDGGTPPPSSKERKSDDGDCPAISGKQIMPAAPNDLHAGSSNDVC